MKIRAFGYPPVGSPLSSMCAGWVGLWRDAGEIHPLDLDLLSNWSNLDDDMRELGHIDGEYYFAPFDWGYTSIVVATDRVDDVLTSWQDLWDEQYRNRISIWNDAEEAIVMTSYAWGLDPYDLSDDDVELLREKLAELHDQTLTYWEDVSSLDQMMIDGEVDIAQAWNETFAAMTDAGVPADYVDPEEGRLGWVCGYSVAAEPGTPEYELAHAYIDAAIAPEAGQYLVDDDHIHDWCGHMRIRSPPTLCCCTQPAASLEGAARTGGNHRL
jgi:spermidine/putrescine transport system substrate-binding protein